MAATILRLNFRGVNVELDVQALQRAPDSRLHRLAHGREKLPLDNEGRHFIDRSPLLFHHILDYYASGVLDFPSQYSWLEVKDEVDFWQVDEAALSPMCAIRYDEEREAIRWAEVYNAFCDRYDTMSQGTWCPNGAAKMRAVWEFLDIPKSSIPSLIYNTFLCIVLPLLLVSNYTAHTARTREFGYMQPDVWDIAILRSQDTIYDWHFYLHVAILAVFLIEMIIRFIVWPSKLMFLSDILNWTDVLAFCGPVIGIILGFVLHHRNLDDFSRYLNACMVFFLFRFFRFWRCYDCYRILMLTLKHSIKDLFLTLTYFVVFLGIFAFFIFFLEGLTHDTFFKTVIDGLWWGVITMTTIGYGSFYPITMYGKIVGIIAAMAGVFMIILPIPALVYNFGLARDQLQSARILRNQQRKQGVTYVAASVGGETGVGLYPPPPQVNTGTTDVASL